MILLDPSLALVQSVVEWIRMATGEADGRGLMEMAGRAEWVLAEAVFFEFALEGFPVDAQEFRGAVFVALLGIEDFEDVFPFELSECFPVRVGWRLVG